MAHLDGRTLAKRIRAAGTPAAGAPKKSSSTLKLVAVVLVVLIAVGAVYYYEEVYNKPAVGNFSERIVVQIGAYYYNATDPSESVPATYYPDNFTVGLGAKIDLVITNLDNVTHGLAVPHFSVDTGPMQPNATVTLSFVASPTGNYTFSEPAADCGGGACDSNSSLADFSGWFVVN